MPRRGENVYKRKDGRWEGRILKPDGNYQYVYAKTYKEVKEKQKNYKKYTKPRDIKQPGPTTSAAELFEYWLNGDIVDQVKPSTYGNYYCCMQNYVIPFFKNAGNECLTENTAAQFTKFIRDNPMVKINLRDFYPWCKEDIFVEITDEMLEAMKAADRQQEAYRRRTYRYKAQYSLDCHDGIENDALYHSPSPEEICISEEATRELFAAIGQLTAIQQRRLLAYYFEGMNYRQIAEAE